jgi:branched-chain amino acid aminotransferase
MSPANQWIAYFNGEFVPESEVRIPFRDRGFKLGDAVFDTTRTFAHRIFRLEEHIDRFFHSLAYLRIDAGLTKDEFIAISKEVAARNLPSVAAHEDIWLTQRVSRGLDDGDRAQWPDYPEQTVIVECRLLPLAERAKFYRDGLEIIVPSVRRPPTDSLSPRAKMNNYLNFVVAELEVKSVNPEAHAILLDTNGNLAEGRGCNIFLVKDGEVMTPKARTVLGGISRQTAVELAGGLGLPVVEKDLDLYDAYTADEAFITSTSWCVCPVSRVNGAPIGAAPYPGPLTKAIMDAYVKLVDYDWVDQYLRASNR